MPRLNRKPFINFFGGEPLLRFRLIKEIVAALENHRGENGFQPRYALTTNGSLMSPEVMDFLARRRFLVELSFDGLAQNIHRKQDSFSRIGRIARDLAASPNIRLETNSVFTPRSVGLLSSSMKCLMSLGLSDIRFSLSLIKPWNRRSLEILQNELRHLRKALLRRHKTDGTIPVVNFREDSTPGIFACGAGKDRLTVDTEGNIWGCFLFSDLYWGKNSKVNIRTFRYGRLDAPSDFDADYASVLRRHAGLSQDSFSVRGKACLFCPELEDCEICPLHLAFTGRRLGDIPPYACRVQRLLIAGGKAFRKALARRLS